VRIDIDERFDAYNRAKILRAVNEWNHVLNGFVRFDIDPAADHGQVWVIVPERGGRPPPVRGMIVGHALAATQPVAPIGGIVIVYVDRVRGYDLASVMRHELWHAVFHENFPLVPRWLNEGLAHLNEDAHGYSWHNLDYRVSAFLAAPERYSVVVPDYYSSRPKPCMNGWGRRHLTVNPIGNVLPCPTAGEIKGLRFDNVRSRPLGWIWTESEAFNKFRGTAWMPAPCRSCEFREIDFGGCRCQAALLTGDPTVTDPACELSPFRQEMTGFVESTQGNAPRDFSTGLEQLIFRQNSGI